MLVVVVALSLAQTTKTAALADNSKKQKQKRMEIRNHPLKTNQQKEIVVETMTVVQV